MLPKSRISNVSISTEDWAFARLGKFTSSRINELMSDSEGIGYIRTRVFESISKTSSEAEFMTESSTWGQVHEGPALRKFAALHNIEFLVTQKLIYGESEEFGSTPDGIWIKKQSLDLTSYDVSTVETKCYQASNHMKCVICENLEELKKADKKAYWQVIDQMLTCVSKIGYLVYFHPDLPENSGGLKVFEFKKLDFYRQDISGNDFVLLEKKKEWALKKFHEIKNKLTNK